MAHEQRGARWEPPQAVIVLEKSRRAALARPPLASTSTAGALLHLEQPRSNESPRATLLVLDLDAHGLALIIAHIPAHFDLVGIVVERMHGAHGLHVVGANELYLRAPAVNLEFDLSRLGVDVHVLIEPAHRCIPARTERGDTVSPIAGAKDREGSAHLRPAARIAAREIAVDERRLGPGIATLRRAHGMSVRGEQGANEMRLVRIPTRKRVDDAEFVLLIVIEPARHEVRTILAAEIAAPIVFTQAVVI